MKLTIIGGSKVTGARLTAQAIAAGHQVTVVSRSGAGAAGARVITGSATDADVAAQAVADADAVVVTVGGAKGVPGQRAAVTRTVIAAMQQAGVRRLLVQSSLGAGDSASRLPGPLRRISPLLLAEPLADHDEQEKAVTASGLDWTCDPPGSRTRRPPGAGRHSGSASPGRCAAPSHVATSPRACSTRSPTTPRSARRSASAAADRRRPVRPAERRADGARLR